MARTVEASAGESAFAFTMFQQPGAPDGLSETQYRSLLRTLENVERELSP